MDEQIEELLRLVPTFVDKPLTVAPLSGGITNRNYRVDSDGESFVLRIGGNNTQLLGIDRQCEYSCAVVAASLGIAPEVIAFLPDHNALITRYADGRVIEPEDTQQPDVMRRAVEALRRYHDSPPGRGSFSPFDTVRTYYALARERQVPFPDGIHTAMDFLELIEESLVSDAPACPCHNDLLPANFIDNGRQMWIIDWEYAGMGDRFFDLGNLAVNHRFDATHECMLLDLYFGEVQREHLRRLRSMRLASDMRESLWGFLQAGISTLDFDFLDYGHSHLARFLEGATALDPELFRTTLQ